jgi:hypothetical protein
MRRCARKCKDDYCQAPRKKLWEMAAMVESVALPAPSHFAQDWHSQPEFSGSLQS